KTDCWSLEFASFGLEGSVGAGDGAETGHWMYRIDFFDFFVMGFFCSHSSGSPRLNSSSGSPRKSVGVGGGEPYSGVISSDSDDASLSKPAFAFASSSSGAPNQISTKTSGDVSDS